jgi:protocatechuate 3,4-dioxygenase beta subunit
VLSTTCKPIAHALLDFWQADSNGTYDNTGFNLRGHQYTDNQGHYSLETIVPGEYPGRTRHIHVKVQAANGPVLTTQLYFPGEARNDSDGIFSPELLMHVQQTNNGELATFNFIIAV